MKNKSAETRTPENALSDAGALLNNTTGESTAGGSNTAVGFARSVTNQRNDR